MRSPWRRSSFAALVADVVANGNCSGCGGCAALSPAVTMDLDDRGFVRPQLTAEVAASSQRELARRFRRICPGLTVRRPDVPTGGGDHLTLGPYVSVWAAWATDPDARWRGSSGGVITALSTYLLAQRPGGTAIAAGNDRQQPLRTTTVQLTSREDALAAAGSRYAPVASVAALDPDRPPAVFVGKPCEADAARRLLDGSAGERPIVLSFFCAGVPSQHATDRLAAELGVAPETADSVRYRGRGWPGEFVVSGRDGTEGRTSYEIAWGQRLGRDIQDRCKICPDGVGMHADIAVGDFWQTDEAGYPAFVSADGVSVAIARTARGHELLQRAAADGVLTLQPADAADVAAVQPTQVRRQRELPGRLLGRRAAGKRVPRLPRFRLVRAAARNPRLTVRAARGTRRRARGGHQ